MLVRRIHEVFNSKLTEVSENILQNIVISANSGIQSIVDLYQSTAITCGLKRKKHHKTENCSKPQWWDTECSLAKQGKYSLLRRFKWSNLES